MTAPKTYGSLIMIVILIVRTHVYVTIEILNNGSVGFVKKKRSLRIMKINFKGEINTTENNASYIADQLENLTNQHDGDISIQITTESDIMRLKMRIAEIVKDKYRNLL